MWDECFSKMYCLKSELKSFRELIKRLDPFSHKTKLFRLVKRYNLILWDGPTQDFKSFPNIVLEFVPLKSSGCVRLYERWLAPFPFIPPPKKKIFSTRWCPSTFPPDKCYVYNIYIVDSIHGINIMIENQFGKY